MANRVTLYIRTMERARKLQEPAPKPYYRPTKRGQCAQGARPCPFVACQYHLATDITAAGSIKLHFGSEEDPLKAMQETCALDVADKGDHDMDVIGRYLNVTGARIQQEVAVAVAKLREAAKGGTVNIAELSSRFTLEEASDDQAQTGEKSQEAETAQAGPSKR